MWNKKTIAATIDHAVLKPFATEEDVIEACQLGKDLGVASVCVRPCDVALAAKLLKGTEVLPSVVIGFPHGSNKSETKAFESKKAIEGGAKELDMVMNIGQFLSGHLDYVQKDIEVVVNEAKPHNVKVKVILEICYLSDEQIERACRLAEVAGADYVKTSTGFGTGPATPEAIDIMMKTVGKTMGVKASGGVRSYETALGYLKQGCKRLGVGSTQKVIDESPE